jgi:hypothetical protein
MSATATYLATKSGSRFIQKVDAREAASITRLAEPLDGDDWTVWHERIHWVFKVCGVLSYVEGASVPPPNKETH